ncbi:MAG: T9SS type A sorting domain-containing protein [Bacteroidetes bacterium]|nr:T9SS type A sorting domain-containing protein [Bacteroidota bacterium]
MLKIFLCVLIIIAFTPYKANSQLLNDFKVNDDTSYTAQNQASLGVDDFGNFVVVWSDIRHQAEEIYCQLFNYRGQKIGNNFRIAASGHAPSIAVRKDGSFGLSWIDSVPKFRLFDKLGNPITNIIKIDSLYYLQANAPSISCDTSGNFVVVFQRKISLTYINIYCQLLDSNGVKIGGNKKINDDSLNAIVHQKAVVTKRRDGSFVVSWNDYRTYLINSTDDIYMQMFNRYGDKIGSNTKVNNDTAKWDYQTLPQISSDDSGRFAIVFTETIDPSGSTYNLLQLYNSDGSPNGNNIRFSNNGTEQYPLVSKRRNGDMVVCFRRDAVSQYIPYIQRINAAGTNIGTPFLMTNYYTTTEKVTSSICLYSDKIITVWNDSRFGSPDIFFNIRSFINPDSVTYVRQISSVIPEEYKLFQNYPNPFNPITNFKFQIQSYSNVRISVYDITGKEIERIIDGYQKPGIYSVRFDGSNLSSGIYFYTLFVDGKILDSKKMILIK